jgi:apolipoprotein N-acyltransferase
VDAFDMRRPSGADVRAAALRAGIAARGDVALIAAPEGAWPYPKGLAALTATPLLAGVDRDGANSVAASAGGREHGAFAKQVLVPGAERRFLGLGRDRYRAGNGPRRLVLPVSGRDLVVAPLVCYEDLFASALGDARRADLLVAVANDGWNAEASWAHLAASRLAAVESGRWLVRATTSGVSAVIDPRGRLAWSSGWETGPRTARVAVGVPTAAGVPAIPVGILCGALLLAGLAGSARRTTAR